MYKLDLGKEEEAELKLLTFVGSERKQGNPRKTRASASFTTLKPLTVWITTNCGKEVGIPDYHACLLRNLYSGQEERVRSGLVTTDWFKIVK